MDNDNSPLEALLVRYTEKETNRYGNHTRENAYRIVAKRLRPRLWSAKYIGQVSRGTNPSKALTAAINRLHKRTFAVKKVKRIRHTVTVDVFTAENKRAVLALGADEIRKRLGVDTADKT